MYTKEYRYENESFYVRYYTGTHVAVYWKGLEARIGIVPSEYSESKLYFIEMVADYTNTCETADEPSEATNKACQMILNVEKDDKAWFNLEQYIRGIPKE